MSIALRKVDKFDLFFLLNKLIFFIKDTTTQGQEC